jgi:tetratricopeptide (TPR) repeat protein
MAQEIWAGRSLLKRFFREFFLRIAEGGKESKSFLSFSKQSREQELSSPQILIFQGENGLGKTSTISQCLSIVNEIGADLRKTVSSLVIDCESIFSNSPSVPSTPVELIDIIYEQIRNESAIVQYFVRYREFLEKYAKIKSQIELIKREDWIPDHFSSLSALNDTDKLVSSEHYSNWLQKKLTRQEYDYFVNSDKFKTDFFIKGFIDASVDIPTLLVFDSYEFLPADLELWIRKEFITRLHEQRNPIMTLISGYGHFTRFFRNDFSEELIYTFDFTDNTLTLSDIRDISKQLHAEITDAESNQIEQYTAGIPMAVIDIIKNIKNGYSCNALTSNIRHEPWNAHEVLQEILDRFNSFCKDEQTRYRLITLALVDQYDESVIATLWNISTAEVAAALTDLRKHTVFFSHGTLHTVIRMLIREMLIKDVTSKTNGFTSLFDAYRVVCDTLLTKEILLSLEKDMPDCTIRYRSSRFSNAFLNLIGSSVWLSPKDSFNHLSAFYLELLYYNPNLIRQVIWRIGEFQQLLSNEQDELLNLFHSGLSYRDDSLVVNRVPVDEIEVSLIEYLEKFGNVMTSFQQSLLFRKKGEIELRSGDLDNALDNFKKSLKLSKESGNDSAAYFDLFTQCGLSFNLISKPDKAIEAFSLAAEAVTGSFAPLYMMGVTEILQGRYDLAVGVLNQAVKINPDNQDAWYNLGLGNAALSQYFQAEDAFVKAIEKGPESLTLWFEYGKVLNKLEKYEDAVKALRKVVEGEPQNAVAWYIIGNSSVALSRTDDAIDAFKKALITKPQMSDALIGLAAELTRKRQYDEAAEIYEKAIELDNENSRLWSKLAKVLYDAQRFEKAVDAGQKSVTHVQNDLEPWMTLGNSYFALGNFTEAISAFKKASSLDPQNPEIWNLIGKSYFAQDSNDESIDAFKQAVTLNPSIQGSWYDLGLAYAIKENFKDAAEAFEKAGTIEPDKSFIWIQLGDMYMALQRFTDAIESYSKSVKLEPDSYDTFYRKGLACLQAGSIDDAIVSFVKAAELSHADIDIWFQMGVAYSKGRYLTEAVQAFEMTASLDPLRPDTWKHLALAKMDLGDSKGAIDAFKKRLELIPDDYDCWVKMGVCYNWLEEYDDAINALQKAQSFVPDDIEVYEQLGLACHKSGDLDGAISFYQTITDRFPEDVHAWVNMALAYHYKGEYQSAVDIYTKVLSISSDNPYTWYNLGLACHSNNQINDAINAYRQAVKLNPEAPEFWFHLGMALNSLELYGESIQAYRKVVQFEHNNTDAWFNLGLSYFIWGQYDDALESYEKVIEVQPDHFEALANLGATNYALSNADKTIEYCLKALALKDEPATKTYLMLGYIMKKDMDSARAEAVELTSVELSRDELIDVTDILSTFRAKNSPLDFVNDLSEKLRSILQGVEMVI